MLVDGVKKGVGTSLCNGQAPESQGLYLTHSFPMHPFSTPWKLFSGGIERVHME